jgi:hypothetical protein
VLFWFGVALLCLGGDAPAEDPPETPAAAETEGAPEGAEAPDDTPEASASPQNRFLADYAPAAIEGPGLRLPEPATRLYVDASYARADDLTGLPFIVGKARNLRFAGGGSLRWRRFSFDAELNFSNITMLDVTRVQGREPPDVDKHETATSLGDLRLGANWTVPLDANGALTGGFGMRVRLPTHTVVFQYHTTDTTLARYVFPYFFHLEPTLILGGTYGRLGFVLNEGLLLLAGPNGHLLGVTVVEPTVLFWSAHYALFYSPFEALALSADLATDIQLNHVSALYFETLNGLVAASVDVGLQIHIDRFRVDLVGRRGLTRDADFFGLLQYAGTQSLMLRLGVRFE